MSGSMRPQSIKGSTADSGMHSLQIKHSPGTVGCYLSGHLLLRDKPNCLSDTDFGAVLTWLTRAFKHFSDVAIACALDILVACLHRNRNPDPRSPVEDAGRISLLVAAADTCLQKVLKLKALVLCGDEFNAGERDDTYVADVDLRNHHPPQSSRGTGQASECTVAAVRWNVTALSANLISTEVSSDRVKGSERVGGQERTGDIAMVASSTFWVLQRASALHCSTRALDSTSDKEDHQTSRPLSVGVILSKSELDIPEKTPWMSESAAAAMARRCVSTGTGDTPIVAVAPKTKGLRATRSASSKAESDAAKSSVSPGLCVWACSAADGIEGLTFTRSLSLSASEVLRSALIFPFSLSVYPCVCVCVCVYVCFCTSLTSLHD
jgi:hypothetical protein